MTGWFSESNIQEKRNDYGCTTEEELRASDSHEIRPFEGLDYRWLRVRERKRPVPARQAAVGTKRLLYLTQELFIINIRVVIYLVFLIILIQCMIYYVNVHISLNGQEVLEYGLVKLEQKVV